MISLVCVCFSQSYLFVCFYLYGESFISLGCVCLIFGKSIKKKISMQFGGKLDHKPRNKGLVQCMSLSCKIYEHFLLPLMTLMTRDARKLIPNH